MRYAEPSSNRAPLLLEGAQASSGPTPIHCDYSGTSDTFGPLSKVKKCTYWTFGTSVLFREVIFFPIVYNKKNKANYGSSYHVHDHNKCYIIIFRDPEYNKRPTFDELFEFLNSSDDDLLSWLEEDEARMSSHHSKLIGSPLEHGYCLYKDLQNTYHGINPDTIIWWPFEDLCATSIIY